MSHHANPRFWEAYQELPPEIRRQAEEAFELLKKNPRHPSLHLKKVGRYWSVRVSRTHRAVGVASPEGILWFWIGTHDDYTRLVSS